MSLVLSLVLSGETSQRLKPQLSQDLICHILVLPRATGDSLELNPMQAQQRHLDDEDLKLQDHAAAQLALNMRAGLADRACRRATMIAIDALVRGIGVGEAIVCAAAVLVLTSAGGARGLGRPLGFAEVFPLTVETIAVAAAEDAEADSPPVAWRLVSVAAGREIDDFLQVDGGRVPA